jgi:hypothetical protein
MQIVERDIEFSGEGDAAGPGADRQGLVEPTGPGAVRTGDGSGPVPTGGDAPDRMRADGWIGSIGTGRVRAAPTRRNGRCQSTPFGKIARQRVGSRRDDLRSFTVNFPGICTVSSELFGTHCTHSTGPLEWTRVEVTLGRLSSTKPGKTSPRGGLWIVISRFDSPPTIAAEAISELL